MLTYTPDRRSAWELEEQVRIDPNNSHLRFRLGLCYVDAERWTDAAEQLGRAHRLKPSDWAVVIFRREVHLHLENYGAAASLPSEVPVPKLAAEDEICDRYLRLLEATKQYQRAHDVCVAVIECRPNFLAAQQLMGRLAHNSAVRMARPSVFIRPIRDESMTYTRQGALARCRVRIFRNDGGFTAVVTVATRSAPLGAADLPDVYAAIVGTFGVPSQWFVHSEYGPHGDQVFERIRRVMEGHRCVRMERVYTPPSIVGLQCNYRFIWGPVGSQN